MTSMSVSKDTSLIICNNMFLIHWVKYIIGIVYCFLPLAWNYDLILLNHIMYMIMSYILQHFHCVKYVMYLTVAIMIVAGNKVS